jgi:hypothetical protein
MTEEANEILELVKEAQSPTKFKLENVIKGVGYPEETVDVYLDVDSAYKLSKINDQLGSVIDVEESEKLEALVPELVEKINGSKLTFHMRGIDQKQVEAIEEKAKRDNDGEETDEWLIDYMCALVAANIIKVEYADGSIEEAAMTLEEAKELRGSLPMEAWDRISTTMQKLTLATGYFRGLTDAGFLQKS